jgi:hypothetical protein
MMPFVFERCSDTSDLKHANGNQTATDTKQSGPSQEDEWEAIEVDARLVYNNDPARQSIAANSDPTFRIDRQALFGLRQERWRAAS